MFYFSIFLCYSNTMAVSDNNTRIFITIPKETGEYLKKRALNEHRTLSNMAASLLIDKVNEEKRGG